MKYTIGDGKYKSNRTRKSGGYRKKRKRKHNTHTKEMAPQNMNREAKKTHTTSKQTNRNRALRMANQYKQPKNQRMRNTEAKSFRINWNCENVLFMWYLFRCCVR